MKRPQSRKNFIRTILLTIMALILGIGIYNYNASNIIGNQMPMPLGYGMSVVISGSMEECLSVNDLIIIKATDDYAVGDIVLFQEEDIFIVHRIVAIDGDTVTTKGDANNVADEPIDKSQIKGVLICDIPGVGAVINQIKRPTSMIMILVAALLLTELSYRREKDKDTEELDEIKAEIEKLIQEMKEEGR